MYVTSWERAQFLTLRQNNLLRLSQPCTAHIKIYKSEKIIQKHFRSLQAILSNFFPLPFFDQIVTFWHSEIITQYLCTPHTTKHYHILVSPSTLVNTSIDTYKNRLSIVYYMLSETASVLCILPAVTL